MKKKAPYLLLTLCMLTPTLPVLAVNDVIEIKNNAASETTQLPASTIAIGSSLKATGSALLIGANNTATAVGVPGRNAGMAIGQHLKVQTNSLAIGTFSEAGGYELTEEQYNSASDTVKAGYAKGEDGKYRPSNNNVAALFNLAIGVSPNAKDKTYARGLHNVAVGNNAQADGTWSVALGKAVTADSRPKIMKDGKLQHKEPFDVDPLNLRNDLALAASAVGSNSSAIGPVATALGSIAKAYGKGAVAVGAATAHTNSVAMGFGARAISATGDKEKDAYAEGFSGYATAIGPGSLAQDRYSTAIGGRSSASGVGTVSLGAGASSTGAFAMALGTNSVARGENNIALGANSQVDAGAAKEGRSLYSNETVKAENGVLSLGHDAVPHQGNAPGNGVVCGTLCPKTARLQPE